MEFCDFHLFVGRKADRAITEPMFETLARHGYRWQRSGPDQSKYSFGTKYEPANGMELSEVLRKIESARSSSIYLASGRSRGLYIRFGLSDGERESSLGMISVSTLMVYLDRDESGTDDNARSFLNLCRDFCIELEPLYAFGDWEEAIDLPGDDDIKEGKVNRSYWLNCFGPELASLTGRRLLMTADWYSIETLPYGGILAAAYLNPRNDPYSNGLERVKRIKSHLGLRDD